MELMLLNTMTGIQGKAFTYQRDCYGHKLKPKSSRKSPLVLLTKKNLIKF